MAEKAKAAAKAAREEKEAAQGVRPEAAGQDEDKDKDKDKNVPRPFEVQGLAWCGRRPAARPRAPRLRQQGPLARHVDLPPTAWLTPRTG